MVRVVKEFIVDAKRPSNRDGKTDGDQRMEELGQII